MKSGNSSLFHPYHVYKNIAKSTISYIHLNIPRVVRNSTKLLSSPLEVKAFNGIGEDEEEYQDPSKMAKDNIFEKVLLKSQVIL